MRKNHAFVPAMETNTSDEAGANLGAGTIGGGELLFKVIQGRLLGATEDAGIAPGPVEVTGASIFVLLFGVAGFFFAEFDADEIVGRTLEVAFAHFGCNFVVGLREHVAGIDTLGVIEDAVERLNVSHNGAG